MPGNYPGIPPESQGKTGNLFPLFEIEKIHVFFSFFDISRPIAILFSASTFFTSNLEVSKINLPRVFLRKWLYRRGFVGESPLQVFPAGPQPRLSALSVPSQPHPRLSARSVFCRTSTATLCSQCSLPDLNREKICQKECQTECQ